MVSCTFPCKCLKRHFTSIQLRLLLQTLELVATLRQRLVRQKRELMTETELEGNLQTVVIIRLLNPWWDYDDEPSSNAHLDHHTGKENIHTRNCAGLTQDSENSHTKNSVLSSSATIGGRKSTSPPFTLSTKCVFSWSLMSLERPGKCTQVFNIW